MITKLKKKSNFNPFFNLIIVVAAIMISCSSIDCPLYHSVYTTYSLRKAGTEKVDTLSDTVYVWTTRYDGLDTLVNSLTHFTTFDLPISYTQDVDTFYFFRHDGKAFASLDTVRIYKTNTPHFESVDCAPGYFHELTNITTTHNGIDSIIIRNKSVDYDAKQHFYIYFKTRN